MPENRESVDCRRIRDLPLAVGVRTRPGDFAWNVDMPNHCEPDTAKARYLYLHLPGESSWGAIRVECGAAPNKDRVWGWDGDPDRPTLTPSIHHVGVWHGYLTAGRLVSC